MMTRSDSRGAKHSQSSKSMPPPRRDHRTYRREPALTDLPKALPADMNRRCLACLKEGHEFMDFLKLARVPRKKKSVSCRRESLRSQRESGEETTIVRLVMISLK